MLDNFVSLDFIENLTAAKKSSTEMVDTNRISNKKGSLDLSSTGV